VAYRIGGAVSSLIGRGTKPGSLKGRELMGVAYQPFELCGSRLRGYVLRSPIFPFCL
jgi:hypothetical protein